MAEFEVGVTITDTVYDSVLTYAYRQIETLDSLFESLDTTVYSVTVDKVEIRRSLKYKDEPVTHTISKTYKLTAPTHQTTSLLVKAKNAGANEFGSISFKVSNPDSLKRELLLKAVANAEEVATLLTSSMAIKGLEKSVISSTGHKNFSYEKRVDVRFRNFNSIADHYKLKIKPRGRATNAGISSEPSWETILAVKPMAKSLSQQVYVTFKIKR